MSVRKKCRLLLEMEETALGLHECGLIDIRKLNKIQTLCRLKVPPISSAKVRSIRTRLRFSQAVFAAVLNTSVSTIQKWETGNKRPSGPSLKLLDILDRKGLEAVL